MMREEGQSSVGWSWGRSTRTQQNQPRGRWKREIGIKMGIKCLDVKVGWAKCNCGGGKCCACGREIRARMARMVARD